MPCPYVVSPHPLAFGHRGAASRFPENTLPSFRAALEAGVDVLELDIHPARDGTPIVIHDDTLDRVTDGRGRVSDMDLAGLRRLDAGFRFTTDGGRSFPFRGRITAIPTLEEVLSLDSRVRLNVDLKETNDTMEERLSELIDRFGARDRVLLCSSLWRTSIRIRRRFPYLATSASHREVLRFVVLSRLGLASCARLRVDALQIPPRCCGLPVLTPRLVRSAHAAGLVVHVWTVNEEEAMRCFLSWGVDGIMSDNPELLVGVMRRAGLRLGSK